MVQSIGFLARSAMEEERGDLRVADRAVVGDGEGGGEEGVAGVDADLHGLLGADELEQQVQELPLISRRRHQVPARTTSIPPIESNRCRRAPIRGQEEEGIHGVPWVVGGDLAELLHALVLARVHARLQDVLRKRTPNQARSATAAEVFRRGRDGRRRRLPGRDRRS